MKNYNSNKLKMSKKSLYVSILFVVISTILIVVVSVKRSLNSHDSVEKFSPQVSQTQNSVSNVKKDVNKINAGSVVENYLNKNDTASVDDATASKSKVKTESRQSIDGTKKSVKPAAKKYSNPVKGSLLQEFSGDELVFSQTLNQFKTHNGIDIKTDSKESVVAVAPGVVVDVENKDGTWGTCVEIKHDDGLTSIYRGLNVAINVKKEMRVNQGDVIGTVAPSEGSNENKIELESSDEKISANVNEGALPTHLHFEVMKDGKYLDPLKYVKY